MPRVLIVTLAVAALEVDVVFLLSFYGNPGIHNLLYLSAVSLVAAFTAFSGWRSKLLGAAGLWSLLLPSVVGAELIAHAAGSCLQ